MKTMTIFILLLMLSVGMKGQRFYVNAGIGQEFNSGSSSNYASPFSPPANLNDFGAGSNEFFTLGYTIFKHLSIELGASYIQVEGESQNGFTPYGTSMDNHLSADRYRAIPGLKLSGASDEINLFGRIGMICGVAGIMTRDFRSGSSSYGTSNNDYETIIRYNGNISAGILLALGFEIQFFKWLSWNTEISYTNEQWLPRNADIIYNVLNGLPTNSNPNLPQFKPLYTISSWGINTGITFKFGKKKS